MCGRFLKGLVVALAEQPRQAVLVQVLLVELALGAIAHEVVCVFDVAPVWQQAEAVQ